ncbi:unnamed protein product [Prorocentrum cordatum]|uniref:Uncharacterized protein n=1 Tax=Prorocentrum cordatum TaxID=2364126 RepID=A0ABN9QZA0_9DINO|nr:unnamed protein product [Polarella glacialis]
MQTDGLVVVLNSASKAAGPNASRLCFHAFVLPHQLAFVAGAVACSFGAAVQRLPASAAAADASAPDVFALSSGARLLLHALNAERVWRQLGLAASGSAAAIARRVMMGEEDRRDAHRSDVGNLGAVHNFARFLLHEFLPALSRQMAVCDSGC